MVASFAILSVLWTAWCTAAILAALSVRKFARRYERRRRRSFSEFRPPAVVVVPFKGLDLGFEESVAHLCTQDYADYRLLCVVESREDPAYQALRDQLARHPTCRADVLVAGRSAPDRGQKVHNLLAAIEQLRAGGDAEEVWVFADSDAVPGPDWLRELVGPLWQHWYTGVTTGYRWMVPPPPPENAQGCAGVFSHFWSHAASILNSSVACFYGYDRFNHAWGGSMAIRRSTAVEGGLEEYFRGALSDDYQVTRMCRAMLLRVYFVPRCLVASPVDYDRRGFLDFARRQYVITRTHAPVLYRRVLGIHLLYFAGFVSAWAALVTTLAVGPRVLALLPLTALIVCAVASQYRAYYRKLAVHHAFDEATARQLRLTLLLDRWATPLWMTLHLLVVLSALTSRTITWRGRRYRIDGAQKIEELGV